MKCRSAAFPMLLLSAIVALPAVARSVPDTVAAVQPAIVGIGTYQPARTPPSQFVGTGFVVMDGRHALTNFHVLAETLDLAHNEMHAVFSGHGRENKARRATLVASDEAHDLALLRFDGDALPALSLGDSSRVRVGEHYLFTGFPIGVVLGLYPVTHEGMISAITPIAIPQRSSRSLTPEMVRRLRDPYAVFQLDGTAYPGNSGSPVYDPSSGKVIGVINKIFVKESKENLLERPSGITYAIPIRYARELVDSVAGR